MIHNSPDLTEQNLGRSTAGSLPDRSQWRWRTEAVSDRCWRQIGTKCHRQLN